MTDIRDYRETIKAAVAAEREADKNWSWNVKAVNKTEARIGWGYLDYIGEAETFTLTIEETPFETDPEKCLVCVIGAVPNGSKVYRFIGPDRWDDDPTIESGIASAIRGMARIAHNIY